MLTAAAASPGHAQAQGDAAIGVGCDQATAAAAKACALEAEADYFDALGRCANTGPGGNLGACSSAAESARTEAQVECGAQEQARHRVCAALGQAPYDPQIKPSNFVRRITNPFLPLEPGTVFTYRGKDVVDTVEVLDETVVIQGVRCVVVRDTNVVEGKLEEDTFDDYAQDRAGNVWYFGEATTEYAGGAAVSNEGAWVAGVDGAKPGIIMPAKPQVGVTSRTEFALGEAEDLARIENLGVRVRLPGGRFGKALQTFEFSPLEPESPRRAQVLCPRRWPRAGGRPQHRRAHAAGEGGATLGQSSSSRKRSRPPPSDCWQPPPPSPSPLPERGQLPAAGSCPRGRVPRELA